MNYKRNLLSVALASATMMLAAQVHAQAQEQEQQQPPPAGEDDEEESEATELDRVVVTGIRAAMERAIDTKRASNEIVEAVSAEDIGKLPDVSIADSIARLPGLTAQRFGGRAQEIHIRGFSGDFSTTTLNGREQVSLGQNRGVEFDQYPSELMSSVVVYKTQNAALIGQGLSGTVDLRTVRPLDYDERVVAVNVRGDMNRLGDAKEYGNRYSLTYIDQFADNTVGLALGYARLNNPSQNHSFGSWGYEGDGTLSGISVGERVGENTRDGFMGTLEFRPGGIWSSTVDAFYSQFDIDEKLHNLETALAPWSGAVLVDRTDGPDGTATSASFTNLPFVTSKQEAHGIEDELLSFGWRNVFQLGEAWTVTADLSRSAAKRDERVLEIYAGIPGTSDTLTYTLNPDGYYHFDFGLDYGDAETMQLVTGGGGCCSWGQDGYLKDFRVEDEINAARLHFERSFLEGWMSSLEFGLNHSAREKSRAAIEAQLYLNPDFSTPANQPIPPGAIWTTGIGFDGLVGGSLIGVDPNAVLDLYNRRSNIHEHINNKNWQVNEDLTTAYVQANIDTELFGSPLRGNVGVQGVYTDQTSTGIAMFNGLALDTASSNGVSYTEWLPSLNLKLELPHDQFLRFGAGRQMARPRMDEMVASANFSINQTGPQGPEYTGGGGNPLLRPWLADAVDLSYEIYFGGTGYFTAGVFHKDLKTYIYNDSMPYDFSQLPIDEAIPPGTTLPASTLGFFHQPVNGEGGSLSGYEVALSVPFEIFWEPLSGFGFSGNYSMVDSSIQPNPDNPDETLPGLSKYVSNMSLYFERWGFSARVSQRSRSDFRSQIIGFGGDLSRGRQFKGEKVTDVQMGYAIQSGPLKDLSFLLQVYNLENEPFRETQAGFPDRPTSYNSYGRTYLFGVNYRF